MADAAVSVRVDERPSGAVAFVTASNQRRLNCLSTPLILELSAAFARLGKTERLRAVVLTGAGDRAFIGGADLNELALLNPDTARLFITRLHQACQAVRDCAVPVIGRIGGFCLGAGLEVAASCDFRAAADTAQFGMPEVQMGIPSVIEAALLPGLIGWGRTREMLLTGALYSAGDALAMGLVEKVAPAAHLDAAVEAWIGAICRAKPSAVRAQKALVNRWERVALAEGILAGIDALSEAYETGEPQTAIEAFFASKRGPR
ncbi:MAG: enoyl-CoA hydratase/isomerase family protein [Hyphomicrobiaceae bacterium]|nr:enoyl-CoA hydratase/isomerase family protein [Hyphomicrobiaceae bacterium]